MPGHHPIADLGAAIEDVGDNAASGGSEDFRIRLARGAVLSAQPQPARRPQMPSLRPSTEPLTWRFIRRRELGLAMKLNPRVTNTNRAADRAPPFNRED